jgi:hypothetical protein
MHDCLPKKHKSHKSKKRSGAGSPCRACSRAGAAHPPASREPPGGRIPVPPRLPVPVTRLDMPAIVRWRSRF